MSYPTLSRGSTGTDVRLLQSMLFKSGFMSANLGRGAGKFGPATEAAVSMFQQTHKGPDGNHLAVDGIPGPNTWWALEHDSGEEQRSHVDPASIIPHGLTPERQKVLETALAYYKLDVREVPNGSNRGPEVDRCLPEWTKVPGKKGPPWCAFSANWLVHEALGYWPVGRQTGSCTKAYKIARDTKTWRPYGSYSPIPGDVGVMLYRDDAGKLTGSGHMVITCRGDGQQGNTFEGNHGNRYTLSLRDDRVMAGWINFYGRDEQPLDWERGVVPMGSANGSTR